MYENNSLNLLVWKIIDHSLVLILNHKIECVKKKKAQLVWKIIDHCLVFILNGSPQLNHKASVCEK